jgi:hypothetical protein
VKDQLGDQQKTVFGHEEFRAGTEALLALFDEFTGVH